MDDNFEIKLAVNDGIGMLEWAGQTDQATLDRAVSLAADDALIGREVDRLEVQIPADDKMAMRALHRAGFRREGLRRNAMRGADGSWQDVLVYARLAIDQVYGPGGFSGVMNSVLPTHRIIGHVLFRDIEGRVLLVETTYKDDWELPGGVIEPNEPPRVGAEREVLEELGIVVQLNQPLVVDWMPPYLGWDDAVEFIFDGGVLDQHTIDQMQLPATEIRAFHWVHEDEMDAHIFSLSSRRLHRLLADPPTIYTEDGRELA